MSAVEGGAGGGMKAWAFGRSRMDGFDAMKVTARFVACNHLLETRASVGSLFGVDSRWVAEKCRCRTVFVGVCCSSVGDHYC